MKITESENPDIVFICLSPLEAKMLADGLITHVGEKRNPRTIIEDLTNQMADLFLD